MAVIVVERVVPGRAVVPEGDRAGPPPEAVGVLRLGDMGRGLDRDQDGAQRGLHVIAVVGVPGTADIVLLVRLLQHGRHLGMGVGRLEEAVDVDLADLAGKADLGIRIQRLIAEEQHAVPAERQTDSRRLVGPDAPQVDTVDKGADPAAGGRNVEAGQIERIGHGRRPFGASRLCAAAPSTVNERQVQLVLAGAGDGGRSKMRRSNPANRTRPALVF